MNPTVGAPPRGSELFLPRLGFGTAPIGNLYHEISDRDAVEAVQHAHASGIRYFDTAPKYGSGLAESRLGMALAGVNRSDLILSTKVGWRLDEYGTPMPSFDGAGIARSLAGSLDRLGMDSIDLLLLHDADDHMEQAIDEALPTLADLRAQGAVRAIGLGMNDSRKATTLTSSGLVDYVLIAGRYTLLEQPAFQDLLPECARRGAGVIAAGVYNSGILADPRASAFYNYQAAPEDVLQRALRLERLCEEHGVPLRAAAIQFPLANPVVSSILVGATTAAEIDDNKAMLDMDIPESMWQALRDEGLLAGDVPSGTSGGGRDGAQSVSDGAASR